MNVDFDRRINRYGTSCFKWDAMEHVFGPGIPKDTLALWVADMDFSAPAEILTDIKARTDHGVLGYTYADEEWYDIAAAWIKRHYRWEAEREWLSYSPGIVPALGAAILSFTEPGDKVLSLTPVYGPFFRVVEDNGRSLISCSLDFDERLYARINMDRLEALCDDKTKVLLLCSPHNPTGRLWTEEELRRLGEFAVKHNLMILSDEIHADFVYDNKKMISIASLDPRFAERSMTCYAPSKTFNIAGLAASAIVTPNPEMKKKFDDTKQRIHLGGNVFGYLGLKSAWSKGDPWLRELLAYLQGNRDYLVRELPARCPGIICGCPESTFLLWLDCRELMRAKGFTTQEELKRFFVHKAHLALNSGTEYGAEGEGFARLNFGCPRAVLEEAVSRLERAVREVW